MTERFTANPDGELIFNLMEKPNYNWGVQSYSTIDEKINLWNNEGQRKLVYHCAISKPKEFEEWYDYYSSFKNVIYRGLNNAKYKLFTSLQVHYLLNRNFRLSPRDFVTQEIDILKNANNNLYPKYFKTIGVQETDFLYLSLMQHYRAKTPFMDFSHSIDSALFFAQDGYEKSWCCNKSNPNNYVSVYWVEEPEKHPELVKILEMLGASLRKAMEGIVDLYQNSNGIKLNIDNIKFERYLSWANPQNNYSGFKDFELGFLTDQIMKRSINYDYDYVLQKFQKDAQAGSFAINPQLLDDYYNTLYEIIVYKTRLTNLNIVAQEGCFIFYNPEQPLVPMEEFWVKNPTYLRLPQLHCIDIHKDLIPKCILPLLKGKGITKEYIYPIEKDIVSSIVGKII